MANVDPKIGFALKGLLGGAGAAAGGAAAGGAAGGLGLLGSLAAGPAAPIALGLGLVGSLISGGIKAKRAKQQLKEQDAFASRYKGMFESGMSDLISQAGKMKSYQGDVSGYEEAQRVAEQQLLGAQGRIPGQDIAREQISQQAANLIGAAGRGARSSQDFLQAIALGMGSASEQARKSELDFASLGMQNRMAKEQALLSTIGSKAGAMAQQRGLEYQSQFNIAQNVLGLQKEKTMGRLSLEEQMFQDRQAKLGALANANAALFQGAGDLATQFGTGLMGLNQANQQIDLFSKIYNS